MYPLFFLSQLKLILAIRLGALLATKVSAQNLLQIFLVFLRKLPLLPTTGEENLNHSYRALRLVLSQIVSAIY